MPFHIPQAGEQGPLEIGERLCDLGWRKGDGARLSLYEDAYAGRATLLLVFERAALLKLTATFGALRSRSDRLQALDVQVFAVSDESGIGQTSGPPFPCLIDRDFKIGQALAAGGRAVGDGLLLLFDATLRLDRIFDVASGSAVEDALARCESLSLAGDSAGQAPILVVPNLIDPSHCRKLIAFWEDGASFAGGVANDAAGGNVPLGDIKRREDVALPDRSPEAQALFSLFRRRLFPEIEKVFNYRVTRWETLRMGCYDAATGGHFRAHRDDTSAYSAHRRFALSLFLNSGDYQGGELIFPEYGARRYDPPAGSGVVFSCSLLHRVLPVTRGRRFGLFGFFFSEAEEAIRQRERANRLKAAIAPPTRHGQERWPGC